MAIETSDTKIAIIKTLLDAGYTCEMRAPRSEGDPISKLESNLREISRTVQEHEMSVFDALCTAYMLGVQHAN